MKQGTCNNSGAELDCFQAFLIFFSAFTYCDAYYTKCISNMYLIIGVCNIKTTPNMVYICMYVCMYVRTYVRTYVCMYVRMYVCMYVCMHAYMHTYNVLY